VRRILRAAAVVTAGLALAGCGSEGRVAEGEGSVGEGKELFTQKCGSCHVLEDAGSNGNIGPNLDEAFRYVRDEEIDGMGFDESTIRDVVRGQISYPVEDPVSGQPGMPGIDTTLPQCDGGQDDVPAAEREPQGCVDDQDEAADSIAVYVASVAGVEGAGAGAGGGGAGGGGETGGQAIFTTNCASCHTLAVANASGTIGPNLDESEPDTQLVVERVTNGKGAMPSFKDQLSQQQIDAVAQFVSENAGG
jgi:mono/diheme cytochrome c family protein